MFKSLRDFVNFYHEKGDVEVLTEKFSVKYDITRKVLVNHDKKILFFKNIEGFTLPVLADILASRERFLAALEAGKDEEAYLRLMTAMRNPLKLKARSDAPFLEERSLSLRRLPVPIYFRRDGGPYITSGIVIARDPENDEILNASIHRLQVLDDSTLAIRVVPRHLYNMIEKSWRLGKDLEVGIVIGAPPVALICAACSPPYGVFEMEVANRLLDGKLEATLLPNGLPVPRESEIVIQGRIPRGKFHDEGPFVDITGTYDVVRKQPVVEVENVFLRSDAWFHAIVPSGDEHKILMGFEREARIWDNVRRVVPYVKGVRLTKGGCGWLHCVISIKKQSEGDGKNAILAAFAAHPSLKLVIVVDEDIDIDDPNDVEWALATRFQAGEDLVLINRVRGSSLDPSADQESLLTSKMGLDATIPLYKPRDKFEKATLG
ncbi:MAG: UbiD family decarboxylase [Thermoprotei archaeon]|nr:MAG: UbiD family decarboxylase [Thermoprotei archaeon]